MYTLDHSILPCFLLQLPNQTPQFTFGIDPFIQFLNDKCGWSCSTSIEISDIFNNSISYREAIQEAYVSLLSKRQDVFLGTFVLKTPSNIEQHIYFTLTTYPENAKAPSKFYKLTLLGPASNVSMSPRYKKTVQSNNIPHQVTDNLTQREKEVLARIANGQVVKQIASELFISTHTVETHKQKLYKKLDVRNIAELGKLAERYGLTID